MHALKVTVPPSPSLPVCSGSLIFTELLLFGWVETKRLYDLRNPGSQGDGSFLGITDGLKGKENGYPGALKIFVCRGIVIVMEGGLDCLSGVTQLLKCVSGSRSCF